MTKEKYLRSIMKYLHCSSLEKKKIYVDIDNDITIALQNETLEEIMERMGSPKEIAEEFNRNLSKAPKTKKYLWLVCLGVCLIALVIYFINQNKNDVRVKEVSQSKIFNQEMIDQQIDKIVECFTKQDYERLLKDYGSDVLNQELTAQQLKDAVISLDDDLGSYKEISSRASQIIMEGHKEYVVNDVFVQFEHRNVVLRLTFDEDMKLSGIFLR